MRQPPHGDLVKVAAVGVYWGTFNPGYENVQFNINCKKKQQQKKQFNAVIVKLLLSHSVVEKCCLSSGVQLSRQTGYLFYFKSLFSVIVLFYSSMTHTDEWSLNKSYIQQSDLWCTYFLILHFFIFLHVFYYLKDSFQRNPLVFLATHCACLVDPHLVCIQVVKYTFQYRYPEISLLFHLYRKFFFFLNQ